MPAPVSSLLTFVARLFLSLIFLMSAVGNKIPKFKPTTEKMAAEGVPAPSVLLVGAILFLIVGSLSVISGCKARIGAVLLILFLIPATYYFHDFWTFEDATVKQLQMIQFMKNLALAGGLLFIVANGPGGGSLDALLSKKTSSTRSKDED